jgi:hypothetical protein
MLPARGRGIISAIDTAEHRRLSEARAGTARWRRWGPYVSSRQWGTVREDYSADGDAWASFPFDQARSRAYRWGEDGLAGICDRWQHLCFAIALWNGRDPFLKERLFGLTNGEGNHGEDVKERWWPLDSTPTHSYMRCRYRYPQAEFPYAELREMNRRRDRTQPEYELIDTGVFDDDRFFDVDVTYAKATPDDICIRIDCHNRGPDPAPLHVLPTLWLRNTWAWGRDNRKGQLGAVSERDVLAEHAELGRFWLSADGSPTLLFCDNESNTQRLWGQPGGPPCPKDGINDHVVGGAPTVDPERRGTKAAAWYRLDVPAGETRTIRLRLADRAPSATTFGAAFDDVMSQRAAEADEFFDRVLVDPAGCSDDVKQVHRLAIAGLMWAKKHYRYDVREWLTGDPGQPPPPPGRGAIRNGAWRHLNNADIISMPDEWEYPWYASWDLAFHTIPLASVDPDFAKDQLILLCREWYMHPNGQLPAYEWSFDDANPPVHAWAAHRVFEIDAQGSGTPDFEFLERVFHKLLINFGWWVNRKDLHGDNVFEGGFLGLDNIGLFDRSAPLPAGVRLEQSDATSWMAMFCLDMLGIALELAHHDRAYEDVATKFFEHFLGIAHAMDDIGPDGLSLWDENDGFFYDVLSVNGRSVPLKVRSFVGLIPLFAVATVDPDVLMNLPDFSARVMWYVKHRPDLCEHVFEMTEPGMGERRLLSVLLPAQLRRVLQVALDEAEFLSPHGVRSLSRRHAAHPATIDLGGMTYRVDYEPAESTTALFGGNSNWRGPVWMPVNYLLVEALRRFHHYLGDSFTVELPTGSGHQATLAEVADDLSHRLVALFGRGPDGRRPVNGGDDRLDFGPQWRDVVTFNEYFHGDTGAGLGASHQTGWTALVAELIRHSGGD